MKEEYLGSSFPFIFVTVFCSSVLKIFTILYSSLKLVAAIRAEENIGNWV